MSMWNKVDKILTRIEKKGFEAANKAHVYSINILLFGCCYATYTFFRDYNDFFIDARTPPES